MRQIRSIFQITEGSSEKETQFVCLFCWLNKILLHEFHVTSSPYQQDVGNEINLKTDNGREPKFLPDTDNAVLLRVVCPKNFVP